MKDLGDTTLSSVHLFSTFIKGNRKAYAFSVGGGGGGGGGRYTEGEEVDTTERRSRMLKIPLRTLKHSKWLQKF